MTFLRNVTLNSKQCNNVKIYQQQTTLPKHSLSEQVIDIDCTPGINSINYKKRPCPYASLKLSGSITIEASICLPIFIFSMLAIIYLINIMYLQTTLQIALEETVREASKTAYITAEFYSMTTNEQADAISADPSIAESLGGKMLSAAYFLQAFLTEENRSILDNSPVKNGSKGISLFSSSIDLSENTADIVLSYTVTIPFVPEKIFSLNMVNHCNVRLYTGKDMSKEQKEDDFYVYYTSSGSVFHTNRYCQYLYNYTEAVRFLEMESQLAQCQICGKVTIEWLRENNPIVYTTMTKACYHLSLDCYAFTDLVFRVPYSSLDEDDKICEQCLKGK